MHVQRDGNCFFNAIVLSPNINIECPFDLKYQMAEQLLNNNNAKALYNEMFPSEEPFKTFIKGIGRGGKYQGTKAALFICFMFEVNICIITNALKCFQIHDTKKMVTLKESKHDD